MRIAVFVLASASFALAQQPFKLLPKVGTAILEGPRPPFMRSQDVAGFVPPTWSDVMDMIPVKYHSVIKRVLGVYKAFMDDLNVNNFRYWVIYEKYSGFVCALYFEEVKRVPKNFNQECRPFLLIPNSSNGKDKKKHPKVRNHSVDNSKTDELE